MPVFLSDEEFSALPDDEEEPVFLSDEEFSALPDEAPPSLPPLPRRPAEYATGLEPSGGSDFLAGLGGAAAGLAAAVPVLGRFTRRFAPPPVDTATGPTAAPGWLTGAGQFVGAMTRGVGEVVAAAPGGLAGIGAAAAAGQADELAYQEMIRRRAAGLPEQGYLGDVGAGTGLLAREGLPEGQEDTGLRRMARAATVPVAGAFGAAGAAAGKAISAGIKAGVPVGKHIAQDIGLGAVEGVVQTGMEAFGENRELRATDLALAAGAGTLGAAIFDVSDALQSYRLPGARVKPVAGADVPPGVVVPEAAAVPEGGVPVDVGPPSSPEDVDPIQLAPEVVEPEPLVQSPVEAAPVVAEPEILAPEPVPPAQVEPPPAVPSARTPVPDVGEDNPAFALGQARANDPVDAYTALTEAGLEPTPDNLDAYERGTVTEPPIQTPPPPAVEAPPPTAEESLTVQSESKVPYTEEDFTRDFQETHLEASASVKAKAKKAHADHFTYVTNLLDRVKKGDEDAILEASKNAKEEDGKFLLSGGPNRWKVFKTRRDAAIYLLQKRVKEASKAWYPSDANLREADVLRKGPLKARIEAAIAEGRVNWDSPVGEKIGKHFPELKGKAPEIEAHPPTVKDSLQVRPEPPTAPVEPPSPPGEPPSPVYDVNKPLSKWETPKKKFETTAHPMEVPLAKLLREYVGKYGRLYIGEHSGRKAQDPSDYTSPNMRRWFTTDKFKSGKPGSSVRGLDDFRGWLVERGIPGLETEADILDFIDERLRADVGGRGRARNEAKVADDAGSVLQDAIETQDPIPAHQVQSILQTVGDWDRDAVDDVTDMAGALPDGAVISMGGHKFEVSLPDEGEGDVLLRGVGDTEFNVVSPYHGVLDYTPEDADPFADIPGGDDGEPPPTGTADGGEPPRPEMPGAIAAKNAVINQVLESMGHAGLRTPDKEKWRSVILGAQKIGLNTAEKAGAVAARLANNPEARVNRYEVMGMTVRVAELVQQRADLKKEIDAARSAETPLAQSKVAAKEDELLYIADQIDHLSRAINVAGTQAGRELNIRKAFLDPTQDRAVAEIRMRRRNGNKALSPEQKKVLDDAFNEAQSARDAERAIKESEMAGAVDKDLRTRKGSKAAKPPKDAKADFERAKAEIAEMMKKGCFKRGQEG